MDGEFSKYLKINQKFNNFEEFAQITKLWNLDFRQIDRGEFEADIVQVASSDLQVSEGKFNRKLDQLGSAPNGLRTFAILANESTPTIWHGKLADQENIMIFPKDGELEAVSTPRFDVFTISFTEDLLLDIINTIGLGRPEDIIREPEIASCNPKTLALLRQNISKVLQEIRLNAPRMTEEQLQYEIEHEIPRSLIISLTKERHNNNKPSPQKRHQTVRRIREYVESNAPSNFTVKDLCIAAGVSERTLRYAFEENLGVSPKAFVNIIRLNRVRRDLRNIDLTEKNISDIANRWGYWHMGQFAADYRKLFGELPSETNRPA